MDFGTLLLNFGLLAAVVYLVARPLLAGDRSTAPQTEAASLAAEHERLLAALRDLDMDAATGKVAPEDYAEQRPLLVARGAAVLRRLDAPAAKPGRRKGQAPRPVEDEIEAAISLARQRRHRQPAGPAPAGCACPACGQAARAADRFCAGCGAALAQPARAADTAR